MKILKLNNATDAQCKKRYIILEQKERMYFSKDGFFVSDKKFALGINKQSVATIACIKLNELREQQKQKPRCTIVFE